jgi:hypothetical protein
MVDDPLTLSVRSSETGARYEGRMSNFFISGRMALADATRLIEDHGDDAGFEAAARADHSRDAGNVVRFCHWRQIERMIAALASDEVRGTVH